MNTSRWIFLSTLSVLGGLPACSFDQVGDPLTAVTSGNWEWLALFPVTERTDDESNAYQLVPETNFEFLMSGFIARPTGEPMSNDATDDFFDAWDLRVAGSDSEVRLGGGIGSEIILPSGRIATVENDDSTIIRGDSRNLDVVASDYPAAPLPLDDSLIYTLQVLERAWVVELSSRVAESSAFTSFTGGSRDVMIRGHRQTLFFDRNRNAIESTETDPDPRLDEQFYIDPYEIKRIRPIYWSMWDFDTPTNDETTDRDETQDIAIESTSAENPNTLNLVDVTVQVSRAGGAFATSFTVTGLDTDWTALTTLMRDNQDMILPDLTRLNVLDPDTGLLLEDEEAWCLRQYAEPNASELLQLQPGDEVILQVTGTASYTGNLGASADLLWYEASLGGFFHSSNLAVHRYDIATGGRNYFGDGDSDGENESAVSRFLAWSDLMTGAEATDGVANETVTYTAQFKIPSREEIISQGHFEDGFPFVRTTLIMELHNSVMLTYAADAQGAVPTANGANQWRGRAIGIPIQVLDIAGTTDGTRFGRVAIQVLEEEGDPTCAQIAVPST